MKQMGATRLRGRAHPGLAAAPGLNIAKLLYAVTYGYTQVQGVRLNHALFYSEGAPSYAMRLSGAMMPSSQGADRRCILAMTVQQMHPVAHMPVVLGILRRLEVATLVDGLIPPHPAHGLSCGRGGAALGLAMLDGQHALSKVGKRREDAGW